MIVRPSERNPVQAIELRALIRMDQVQLLRFAPPDSQLALPAAPPCWSDSFSLTRHIAFEADEARR